MVSIILPVYNVENYISACIESILKQNYRDFELIIVDDGSPDKSINIAKKVLDNNTEIPVRIIKKKNGGVSSARNMGLQYAKGEFVVMVDSDDIVSDWFLKNLVELSKKYSGLIIYSTGYEIRIQDGTVEKGKQSYIKVESLSIEWSEAQEAFFERTLKFLLPSLMIKTSFLIENGIAFDERVTFSEDLQFVWRCLAYNRKNVAISSVSDYFYISHGGSTMTASGVSKIETSIIGINSLHQEIGEYLTKRINQSLISRHYFAMLHSSSKMLTVADFMLLYNETNSEYFIKRELKTGNIKVRLVCFAFQLYVPLGYWIMRLF